MKRYAIALLLLAGCAAGDDQAKMEARLKDHYIAMIKDTAVVDSFRLIQVDTISQRDILAFAWAQAATDSFGSVNEQRLSTLMHEADTVKPVYFSAYCYVEINVRGTYTQKGNINIPMSLDKKPVREKDFERFVYSQ